MHLSDIDFGQGQYAVTLFLSRDIDRACKVNISIKKYYYVPMTEVNLRFIVYMYDIDNRYLSSNTVSHCI